MASRRNSLRRYLLKHSTEKEIARATQEFNDTHEGVVEKHCKFEVDRLKRALEVSVSRTQKLIKLILALKDEKEALEDRLDYVSTRFESYKELGLERETIKEDTKRLKNDLDKLKSSLKF